MLSITLRIYWRSSTYSYKILNINVISSQLTHINNIDIIKRNVNDNNDEESNDNNKQNEKLMNNEKIFKSFKFGANLSLKLIENIKNKLIEDNLMHSVHIHMILEK